MAAALEVTDLTLRFGGVTALDRLNLSLPPERVLGLAGPNGSGKSSLINALTGHYDIEGRIMLNGRRIDRLSPPERVRLGITRTFQSPRSYRRMTVLDNLHAARHAIRPFILGRAARRREQEKVRACLAAFGLDHLAGATPDALTPFELRLLELARVHAIDAQLVLLDEPAAGATEDEADRLSEILAERLFPGRTVILIEHRMSFLHTLCNEFLVLQAGRTLAHGTRDAVFSARDVRACLIGEPAHA
jgi:ABC-type branched-subunit amino acid transport system ATPase component